jgi:FlaA1/EpsC-like NDP-sugar epimerase
VAEVADRHGVERFVLISTDKAVFPSSVMGSTKLVAERYTQGLAAHSQTRFIIVRFGNVLDSAGSVVPTFRRQIEEGGPITVTHPEMERFFMTIPEAVQLVLQAGAIGRSGDVLVLEMGDPVKIVDLAKDMIFLSGLKYPDDIDIVFTGVRPGEKLTEELFYDRDNGARKVHEKIYCASPRDVSLADVKLQTSRLAKASRGSSREAVQVLRDVVAHFTAGGAGAAAIAAKKAA